MKRIYFLILLLSANIYLFAQTQSYKRGLAVNPQGSNLFTNADLSVVSPGISWFYNWATTPVDPIDNLDVDYVPMAWCYYDDLETMLRTYLETRPNVKYILGYNEPDHGGQANMTPEKAVEHWHIIEKVAEDFNLKIVSPVVAGNINWLDRFFELCPECRVDYIGVHVYVRDLATFQSVISQYYKYNKPLWLTEFCSCLWESWCGALPWGANVFEIQRKLLVETVDWLETNDKIYRYSWFLSKGKADPAEGELGYQILEEETSELTDLGKVYVNMSSYDKDFYHTTAQRIEAEHYISMKDVSLFATDDESGQLHASSLSTNSQLNYQIDVPKTGEYFLNVRVAGNQASQLLLLNENAVLFSPKMVDIPNTNGVWKTVSISVNLTAGKQTLSIKFDKVDTKLNWLSFTSFPAGMINSKENNNAKIYSTLVDDEIRIESEEGIKQVTIYNTVGMKVRQVKNASIINMSDLGSGIYFIQCLTEKDNNYRTSVIKK